MAPKKIMKRMAPKKVVKKKMEKNAYRHYTQEELRLLAKWAEKGKEHTEIATLLDRDLSSVCRHSKRLEAGEEPKKVGRRKSLEPKQIDRLVELAE